MLEMLGIPHFPNEYVGKRSFEIKIWDDNIGYFWSWAIPNSFSDVIL